VAAGKGLRRRNRPWPRGRGITSDNGGVRSSVRMRVRARTLQCTLCALILRGLYSVCRARILCGLSQLTSLCFY
jgi:hypothetical protein